MSQKELIYREVDSLPEYLLEPALKFLKNLRELALSRSEAAENEYLTGLVYSRLSAYTSAEDLSENSLSQSDLLSHLGLTQADIDNAEDVDLI